MYKSSNKTPLAAAILTICAASTPALAQSNFSIEEVTVTAQRKSQSLQEVPIAITAFSAETIEKSRIDGLDDIASRTPGFTIGQQGPTAPELTIRGIGSTDREAGSDRSVVVFVDEVYVGRAGASTFDLFDLERIEVLRGPQGTLYGKNVVGGAVNLITAKPTNDTRGKFKTTVGNHGLFELQGLYNTALSDSVYGKVSASIKKRDGYFDNIQVGRNNSDAPESQSIRGQVLFQPSDTLSLLVSAEYSHDEVSGISNKITQGETSDADFAAALAPFNFTPNDDLYSGSNNIFGGLDRDIYALSARLNWSIDLGDLTYISAFRSNEFTLSRDIAGLGISNALTPQQRGFESSAFNDEEYEAISQELRLASSTDNDSPLSWVTGLYYLAEETNRDQVRQRKANTAFSRPLFDQNAETTSWGVFAEFTYDISETVSVTAGSRYTSDKKEFDLAVSNTYSPAEQAAILAAVDRAPSLSPASTEFSTSANETWSASTPKLVVDWQVTEDILLFATASKGFKSGGFVGLGANELLATTSFSPEFAYNYEIGTKSQFMDDRLQLNLSFFQVDFEDLQLRDRVLLIPGDETSAIVTIANAAEAEIKGVDLEFVFLPIENLKLSGSYSYLDTEITVISEGSNLKLGSRLPRAPERSWVLTADYNIEMNQGNINIRGDYRYTGDQFFDLNEQTAGHEQDYGLFDARVAYESDAGGWELSLWAKNLGDKEYRNHVQSIRSGRAGLSKIGAPRTFGLSYIKHF